jgi:hypothetical protein
LRSRHIFLLFLILLAACSSGKPTSSNGTSVPVASATTRPTAGPTPTPAPPLVILVVPTDMNEDQSKAYQKAVYDLAQAQAYRFVVLNKISNSDLEPALKIVIDLSPDSDVNALAGSAPQTQFLAINLPGVQPGGNISVLGGEKTSIDKVAFMAGYIAATITQDYHTGVLVRKGSADAETIHQAFKAGQEYFCGLCNPYAGPFEEYPLIQDIPEDAKPSEYGAYADILIRRSVDTMFIEPGVDIPELLQYLQTVGILMIGTQTPSKKVSGWVVTLQPNYLEAMKAAFPDLVAGQGGKAFPAPLSFNEANTDLFGLGKQNNARQVLDDLLKGFISTEIK